MTDTEALIDKLYSAFNRRDIDAAVALMTHDIHWPKASEGGHVVGKDEIRAYWTRQWSEFDPRVEPLVITQNAPGQIEVTVHQLVKNLQGKVLFDGKVDHRYTIANELIERMELKQDAAAAGPSSAFL